jgi:hypothetical protein
MQMPEAERNARCKKGSFYIKCFILWFQNGAYFFTAPPCYRPIYAAFGQFYANPHAL